MEGGDGAQGGSEMTPIFITSWNRPHFLLRVIEEIRSRTEADTYSIHVLDNGSSDGLRKTLFHMAMCDVIQGLTALKQNTQCIHPKHVFAALVPDSCEFHVVTDNDFIPARGWLPRMLEIMRRNPSVACLTANYYPYWPMGPGEPKADYVPCQAVGNTFRVSRTAAVKEAMRSIPNEYGLFSDDGLLSQALQKAGCEVGFARDVFTYNLELTEPNWGYTEAQLQDDPRKAGYQPPERYAPVDWDTLAVPEHLRIG